MYAAAKAAMMAFTRSHGAPSGRRVGIRVNALAPGTVDTDMVRNNPPEAQARMAAASPMNRAAHADEMVGPVLFLVSDAGELHDRPGRARRRRHGAALRAATGSPHRSHRFPVAIVEQETQRRRGRMPGTPERSRPSKWRRRPER